MIDDKVKISIEAGHFRIPLKAREIPGWFNDFDLFEVVATKFDLHQLTSPVCVEIGSWLGRSTVGLVQACLGRAIKPVLYAVDTWEGTSRETAHAKAIAQLTLGETLFDKFYDNVQRAACKNYIFQSTAFSTSGFDEQRSLDFVSLTAIIFEAVTHDLNSFLPRAPDRIMAGHDYTGASSLSCHQFAKQHNFQIKTR
jgi:hypothetical protein